MKYIYTICLILMLSGNSFAAEWHVKTIADGGSPSSPLGTGDGTLNHPWDLQTALNQPTVVQPGDIIWVHEGVNIGSYGTKAYEGRYKSWLNYYASGTPAYITVCAWPGDHPVLNGNVPSALTPTQKTSFAAFYAMEEEEQMNYKYANRNSLTPDVCILEVLGPNTTFRNLELTLIGNIERRSWLTSTFEPIFGLIHTSGTNCKFINLIIHNASRSGVSSWKETAGSQFHGCIVYNNGDKIRTWDAINQTWIYSAAGVGFYIQNSSDEETRIIDNNIVFNNYYKGMEIWSESTCANPNTCEKDFVKNITVTDCEVFNNSSPFYEYINDVKKDNIIVATNDSSGETRARNITLRSNFLYHTTDLSNNPLSNDASSLTIGWNSNAPVSNVVVDGNWIVGRNNGLKIFYADTLTYINNRFFGKYINSNQINFTSGRTAHWSFSDNVYWNFHANGFRIAFTTPPPPPALSYYDTDMATTWSSTFNTKEVNSYRRYFDFVDNPIAGEPRSVFLVNKIIQNQYNPNRFTVVLCNWDNLDMIADFSSFGIPSNATCTIRDVENYHTAIPGVLTSGQISLNMQSTALELPTFVTGDTCYAIKTGRNFGVFIVDFDVCTNTLALADPTNTVNNGDSDLQQASTTITATNTINNGGNAIYHAGGTVELKNGFTAVSGSDFRGYIAGCNDLYFARHGSPDTKDDATSINELKPTLSNQILKIFPNPSNSIVNVEWEKNISEISLTSIDGKLIFERRIDNVNQFEIDLSNYEKGIYLLSVKSAKGEKVTKKIVKQ